MPLIFEKQFDPAKKLAVWHITESDMELFAINDYIPDTIHSFKRNRELVVSRILLNHLLGYDAHFNLTKDKFGKPFLDNSAIAVSFSHSQDMVACMVDMEGHPIGIDIEKVRDRIKLLADKFCTDNDRSDFVESMHYHLVWGGKEVLYKIFSKKELDFKENLSIEFHGHEGIGRIVKNGNKSSHRLGAEVIGEYVLVWGS